MRESHCFGHTGKKKLVFETKVAAHEYIQMKHHTIFRPYQCPDCKKWHLTQKR